MIKRFLLYGIDSSGDGLAIGLGIQDAVLILSDSTLSSCTFLDHTRMRAESALHNTILQLRIKHCLFHGDQHMVFLNKGIGESWKDFYPSQISYFYGTANKIRGACEGGAPEL